MKTRTRHLPSRRTFLRAAGVAIGLPAFASLLPPGARAGGAAPTKRFVSTRPPTRSRPQFAGPLPIRRSSNGRATA